MDDLRANLDRVRARVADACRRAGRAERDVTLIAVSKTWPAERVVALAKCGHAVFGENRVQEAQAKIPAVASALAGSAPPAWHLIGPLQRNKARHAVGLFELLHGVDDTRLLTELDRRAAAAGLVQDVLLQVNVGREATKAGVDPDRLASLADAAAGLGAIRVQGLMTIPPREKRPQDSRRWFDALRELRDRTAPRVGLPLEQLSMGMSAEFEIAIEAGATLVRVGTALFGQRL